MATRRQAHKYLLAGDVSTDPTLLICCLLDVRLEAGWSAGPGDQALVLILRQKESGRRPSILGNPNPLASSNRHW
jgi:hypothetical protein